MSHHLVAVEDLRFQYPDGTAALSGISFEIPHGQAVALVGANGAGKSTLLLHLNGYLTAEQGIIRIGDDLVSRKTLPAIRRAVGMVFQDPDDMLFMPSVAEDIAFGPLNQGLPPEEVEAIIEKVLHTVDANHIRHKPPYRLSAGEKRAVAIAAVLAMSPDILVMDEPSANLDPRARRRLINLLQTFEHTKIIATHDLDMALEVCPRTIVLHQGRILADGPTLELLQDSRVLEKAHLEKPLRLQGCPVCKG